MRRSRFAMMVILSSFALASCEDDWGPQFWVEVEDTVVLYSMAREEFGGLPSAYDFLNRVPVRLELVGYGGWDMALGEDSSGLLLVPPGAFPAFTSMAGIAELDNRDFYEVDEAPRSGDAYEQESGVPIRENVIYIVRSREYGHACLSYTKMEIIDVDVTAGTLRFRYINNPHCGDRALVPPESE